MSDLDPLHRKDPNDQDERVQIQTRASRPSEDALDELTVTSRAPPVARWEVTFGMVPESNGPTARVRAVGDWS
jgi:hypothetical protein